MICGKDIAAAMFKLLKKRPEYDPDARPTARLPRTMRELVEGDFDRNYGEQANEEYEYSSSSARLRLDDPGLFLRHVGFPVRIKDLNHRRPLGLFEVEDHRHEYPLLSAYWQWLKRHRRSAGIDIDHPLADIGECWPIWRSFHEELKNRTGLTIDDIFPQIEQAMETGEEQSLDFAVMPFYDNFRNDESVPLIEMLQKLKVEGFAHLPEYAQGLLGEVNATKAAGMLANIWHDREFWRLPAVWKNALAALCEFQGSEIIFYDWWEANNVSITGPDAIDDIFTGCERPNKLRMGMDPLVDAFVNDTEKFWRDMGEELHDAAKRKTKKV